MKWRKVILVLVLEIDGRAETGRAAVGDHRLRHADVGDAVTVKEADGWNRLTLFAALGATDAPLKAAAALSTKVATSVVGSGSVVCTMLPGQPAMTGSWLSLTVMLKLHVAVLPLVGCPVPVTSG